MNVLLFDLIILGARVIDGHGESIQEQDVGVIGNKIAKIGDLSSAAAKQTIDAKGLVLAPGFVDVHTHDDLEVIRSPEMECKLSQGITTVIVGNCGISAAPVKLTTAPPDPMNLLGLQAEFKYQQFSDYVAAVEASEPAVNVAALVGHTALRNNVMDDLFRPASETEIQQMRGSLRDALSQGALGLSSGLAYATANQATSDELESLATELAAFDAFYTTHLRTEFDGIKDAMHEAFKLGRIAKVPVVISHLKCAGKNNWGRSKEVLGLLEDHAATQNVSCDCYPYSASSSTLDLKQVTDDFDIFITWSDSHPQMAGQMLASIAQQWGLSLSDAAIKLQPAGAVYHGMDENDVINILQYEDTMIGSDGLPCDPKPHPRLWGAFPRVLGHYCRTEGIFDLPTAVSKMTGLPAKKYNLGKRGLIKQGYFADLVLFDPDTITDSATFINPIQKAQGIESVWVNGKLSYHQMNSTAVRAGHFLKHKQSEQNYDN